MPPRPHHPTGAADALLAAAPLISRWIERLLAAHQPPLTTAQFLALRTIASEDVSAGELARRTGVSGPAISQLLASLADAGLLERRALAEDRRRQQLAVSADGQRTLRSIETLLRESLAGLLQDIPRPELDALTHALPFVEAALAGTPPPRRPPHAPPRTTELLARPSL